MNNYEKAKHCIEELQYDEFFKLMNELNVQNATLQHLKMEFMQGIKDMYFQKRLLTCLHDLFDAQTGKKKATHLTPFYPSGKFIGREKELHDLHTYLLQNLPTVVVNGIGGIGKTSLAKQYVMRNGHHYDHIVWLEQAGEAINAFTDNIHLRTALQLAFQQETEEERLHMILHRLAHIQGTNLLVLDNYQRNPKTASPYILTHFPFAEHWRVLCTSREEITDFTPIALDTLPEEEAMALFKMHAQGKNIDDTELKSLLQDIGSHTLMIELLAKNYKANSGLRSIKDFADKIQARQIDADVLQRNVATPHTKGEIKLYTYLLKVFDYSALDAQSLHILTQIVVLPAEALPIVLILLTKEEEQETYREVLENLVRKGWLAFVGEDGVQMHRLMQLVLLKALQPTYKDCKILCYFIIEILRSDEAKANPLAHQGIAPFVEALLQHMNFQEALGIKSVLQAELANFYYYAGDYAKAISIAVQNKDFTLQVFGKESQEYPTVLNNLANLYNSTGKYEEALLLLQECLQIREQVVGKQHLDYAIALHNLANLYQRTNKYKEALPLLQESLQICEQVVGKQHPHYATSLNDLAGLHENTGKYAEALPLYQESLQIREQVLGKQHPNYATSLNNLASLYQKTGKYAEALPLLQECLQICEQVLGEQHPYYAATLNNLAGLYESTGKYAEALPLYQECLQIREQVLGKQHLDFAMTLYNIGGLLIRMQQIEEGIQHILTAYQLLQENVGEEHPYTQRVKKDVEYFLQMMQKE